MQRPDDRIPVNIFVRQVRQNYNFPAQARCASIEFGQTNVKAWPNGLQHDQAPVARPPLTRRL